MNPAASPLIAAISSPWICPRRLLLRKTLKSKESLMASSLVHLQTLNEQPRRKRLHHEHDRALGAAIDAEGLEAALRDALTGEVRFSKGDRALYATDGSN